jgi:hypothetical protein
MQNVLLRAVRKSPRRVSHDGIHGVSFPSRPEAAGDVPSIFIGVRLAWPDPRNSAGRLFECTMSLDQLKLTHISGL